MTRESIDIQSLPVPEIKERQIFQPGKTFLPFDVCNGNLTPEFLPIGGEQIVRQTSSTHGIDGYITTVPSEIGDIQNRLDKKLKSSVDQFSFYEEHMNPGADTLVIAYGVTSRAAKTAVEDMKKDGKPVSLLILKTLWPVPENLIRKKTETFKRVIAVEMNLGQYVREIKRVLPGKQVRFFGQMNGSLITPAQIKEVISDDKFAE